MPKTPDSESLYRADNFAPDFSSRGLLGLEIQAKIVSIRFLFLLAQLGMKDAKNTGFGILASC